MPYGNFYGNFRTDPDNHLWKREEMGEERSGKDRRSGKERRKGGTSGYEGPEQRSQKYRRSDVERRERQREEVHK